MSRENRRDSAVDLYTVVDDDLYDEVAELVGDRVVHVVIWEDSLADALNETETVAAVQSSFDIDLYLESGVYFELYDVNVFDDPSEEPLVGWNTVSRRVLSLINQGLWLDEIAVDDESMLVLILYAGEIREAEPQEPAQPDLYLVVGGWLVDEWDEIPAE